MRWKRDSVTAGAGRCGISARTEVDFGECFRAFSNDK